MYNKLYLIINQKYVIIILKMSMQRAGNYKYTLWMSSVQILWKSAKFHQYAAYVPYVL